MPVPVSTTITLSSACDANEKLFRATSVSDLYEMWMTIVRHPINHQLDRAIAIV